MSNESEDLELFHFGVKGMKWGVRKDRPEGVSARTNREAKSDAKKYAQAQMLYGESAGTRRKLIKATVNSKSKDSSYKKAFDYHLENQDMAKRASQARGQRQRRDVRKGTAKTARGVKNLALQTGAPVAMSSLAIYTAYQNPKVRATVNNSAKTAYQTVKTSPVVKIVKNKVGL